MSWNVSCPPHTRGHHAFLPKKTDGRRFIQPSTSLCSARTAEEENWAFKVFRLLPRAGLCLPRRFRARATSIVCPECERPISSELSGLDLMEPPARDLSALQAWATTESAALAARFVSVVDAQTDALRAELQETRAWNEALRSEVQETRERIEAVEVELSQATAQFERTLDELHHEHARARSASRRARASRCRSKSCSPSSTRSSVRTRSPRR